MVHISSVGKARGQSDGQDNESYKWDEYITSLMMSALVIGRGEVRFAVLSATALGKLKIFM